MNPAPFHPLLILVIAAGATIALAADAPPKAAQRPKVLTLELRLGRNLAQKRQVEQPDLSFEEQAESCLRAFREHVEQELHYVERTCGLTDDDATTLHKRAFDVLERARTELAKAWAAEQGQPRHGVAIVNGNFVDVPVGINGEQLTDPAKAARQEVRRQIIPLLRRAAQIKLSESQQQQNERTLVASRLAALAILDEELILSRAQRDAIYGLLTSVLRTPLAWDRNPILVSWHAGETLYSVHSVLSEAQLAPLLRPAQQAAWKSLSVINRPAFVVQLQFEQKLGKNVRLRVVIRNIEGAATNPTRAGAQRVSHLELIIDDIALECALSDAQRLKLHLAAELDAKRVRQHEADAPTANGALAGANAHLGGAMKARRQGEEGALVADRVVLPPSILTVDPQIELVSNAASAYQRVLKGKLSSDQLQRLSELTHERRVLYERAAVAAVLQAIDARVFLSSEQHGHLTKLLQQHLAAAPDDDELALPRAASMTRLARTPARQLEPMFDDVQRPVAMSFWEELCAAIATPAAGPGVRKQERPAGLNLF